VNRAAHAVTFVRGPADPGQSRGAHGPAGISCGLDNLVTLTGAERAAGTLSLQPLRAAGRTISGTLRARTHHGRRGIAATGNNGPRATLGPAVSRPSLTGTARDFVDSSSSAYPGCLLLALVLIYLGAWRRSSKVFPRAVSSSCSPCRSPRPARCWRCGNFGQTLNIFSQIGLNHVGRTCDEETAILIVEFANQRLAAGAAQRTCSRGQEAAGGAAAPNSDGRTLATILGILPIALAPSAAGPREKAVSRWASP